MTGYDALRPERMATRIRSAYARAADETRSARWTLERPRDWPAETSLDDELDTRDLLRELEHGPPLRPDLSSAEPLATNRA